MFKLKNLKYFYGAKIALILTIFILYNSNNYLFFNNIYFSNDSLIEEEENIYDDFKLMEKSLKTNISLINEEKSYFFDYILNKNKNKKIMNYSSINKYLIYCKAEFGNLLIILNKIIFYNRFFSYNNVVLDKKNAWFIKNKIFIKKYNITLEVDNINKYKNNLQLLKPNNIYLNCFEFFYFPFKIKSDITINLLKNEILQNIPKTIVSPDDLYVHIRSGDIFSYFPFRTYSQPPLCFYEKVFDNFNFKKKILITNKERNNPIIRKIIKLYPEIISLNNSLEKDISYLINAYNIIGSISSFLIANLLLNSNLKFLWDYNIYQIKEKIYHLHYDLFKFPNNIFTIYRMEPSPYYKKNMQIWKNNKKQRYIMLNEKCINDFKIIKRKDE